MSSPYRRVNFYDLCRLCAQSIQDTKFNIFELIGQEIQLQSKIKKCLSMTITEDDFLPKVVCSRCINQLEVCNAFREECRKSEKMLSSYFKNYRHTEDFKKSGKVYIKDTAKIDLSNDIVRNSPINKLDILIKESQKVVEQKQNAVGKSILQTQANIKTEQNNKNKFCELAGAIVPNQNVQIPYTVDFLNETLKKAVQQLPKEIISKVTVNSNGEVINLPHSDLITLDPISIPTNVIIGLNNIKNNKTKANTDKFIKEPILIDQNIVKIDLTKGIKETTVNKFNLDSIIKENVHSAAPAVVQNTSVIFPLSQYQGSLISTSTSNTTFSQVSSVTVPSSTANIIGMNNDNNNSDHNLELLKTVNEPPPSSVNLEDLRSPTYMLSPVQEKVISEDLSRKPTKEPGSIKTHICEVCSKSFKRREHLYQHFKLHSSLRPYRCVECKKSFVRKEHLIRHMVLHSGERNFTCEICNKSFSRHDNLLKHIRTHNKESNYTIVYPEREYVISTEDPLKLTEKVI
ncbi:zinc finger and BTB domain-containing protein 6-like [Sitophilus oryzae]|uniref:Zinc finger and BTB domain-containing protein 6-like n=1 Tax=Sitophilus oryzae TaxID=7048 RepID=A0A6J2YC81_SITOR|nr:zinc finger and BTB domain-containing protein 6-like [Sitophilus oryzae]